MAKEKTEDQEVATGGFICVPEEFRAALMQRWVAELVPNADEELKEESPDDPE